MKAKIHIQLFRAKIKMHLNQYVERMKIFMADEKLAGAGMKELRDLKENPASTWNMEREALNKTIKKEVASLVNRIHIVAYREGL